MHHVHVISSEHPVEVLRGKHIVTDDVELGDVLVAVQRDPQILARFHERYGAFVRAIRSCEDDLRSCLGAGTHGALVIFCNRRVQLWPAAGIAARPSVMRKLVPLNDAPGQWMVGFDS